MALRTASKRAYLTGEGKKRKEWGIATVIMNKRGNPCPLCLPFIDKDILRALKVDILKDVNDNDIITEIRHDSEGNIVPIIYVDVDDFYSSYQGRIYVGDEGLDGIFDDNRNIKVDNLWEIISETMPHYMNGEEPPNDTIAKIYELIDEVFNEKQG